MSLLGWILLIFSGLALLFFIMMFGVISVSQEQKISQKGIGLGSQFICEIGQMAPLASYMLAQAQEIASPPMAFRASFFAVMLVFSIFTWPIVGIVLILAGRNMRNLRSYSFAVAGAVAALLPLTPLCLFSMAVGIWSLVVLNHSDVKKAFVS